MKKILLVLPFLLLTGLARADGVTGVVVQADHGRTQLEHALKLASNMHEVLRKTKFEVVVFGPTVKLLKAFSPVAPLIHQVANQGIKVIACGRSLKTDKVPVNSLAFDVTVVPFGAVHIVQREHQGWEYFRP